MHRTSLHPHSEQQTPHPDRVVTLWAGIRPDELAQQLLHLDRRVVLAFYNRHKPIRQRNLFIHFIHIPGKKRNSYGFGIKIKTFKNGGGFTISTLASDCASGKAKLIPALLSLGVKDPEEHVSFFVTIH